jgi:cation diffusion facilitator CzcD-associated flavoprotein CzcO
VTATEGLPKDGAIGLEALEERLNADLAWLNLPPVAWLPPTAHAEGPVVDIAVVGAGMGGLAVAGALRLLGLHATLFDKAPRGFEGPWATTALMETLRSPKQLDLPALSFYAWYQSQFGRAAWAALDKIPRLQWADYLCWYRRVLGLDVRSEHEVKAVRPRQDHVVELTIEHESKLQTVLARRVVLALGLDAFAGPLIPDFVNGLARDKWSHSIDPLDYGQLAGRRVGVVGAGAAAMDCAGTALEAGAARVDLLIRRQDFPRINYAKGAGNPGFQYGYTSLADEWKFRFAQFTAAVGLPPPRASVLRVSRHANAHFNFDCPVGEVKLSNNQLLVSTPRRTFEFDYLILATGFRLDWALHPEFAGFSAEVKTWADTFTPPSGTELPELAATPYLSRIFQFEEKVPGCCPGLEQIYCFCFPSTLSTGHVAGLIPGVSIGAKRLAEALASSLYNEDREIFYQRILNFNDPEVLGDEWQPEIPDPQQAECR